MAFDSKRFAREKFEPRTESVPVPALADWFGEGEAAEWKVRGITGNESARINEAATKARATGDLAAALASAAGSKERIDGILTAAGLPTDAKQTPEDMVRRLEMLVIGSVEPAIDLPVALQLAKAFPFEFFQLTTRIIALTGLGHIPGKPKPSGSEPT